MGIHTFYCEKCDKHFNQFVAAADMPRTLPCTICGSECKKDFTFMRHGVIDDTWKKPQRLTSLKGSPIVDSNSGMRRAMKAHDRKHGTKLEAW